MEPDWQALLVKYMHLVSEEEGVNFLGWRPPYITPEEFALLQQVAVQEEEMEWG